MTWSIRTQQPLHLERRLRQVALVAALAVVAYLGLAVLSDASAIRDGLQRLGPAQWLVLLGLSLLNYALRFLRWHAYLRALGARIGLGHDLLIYVAGFAFTVTPGKAGEAVRSVYLKTAGVPWSPGLAALAVERVLDLTAMVMLAALALRIFADQMLPALLLVIGVVGILLLVTRPGMAHWLLAWLPKRGRWVNLKEGALAVLEQARLLLAPKRLLGGLGLGLLAWAAEAWGFYLLLGWLGLDAQLFAAMGIYALGMLAGALSFRRARRRGGGDGGFAGGGRGGVRNSGAGDRHLPRGHPLVCGRAGGRCGLVVGASPSAGSLRSQQLWGQLSDER